MVILSGNFVAFPYFSGRFSLILLWIEGDAALLRINAYEALNAFFYVYGITEQSRIVGDMWCFQGTLRCFLRLWDSVFHCTRIIELATWESGH